LLAATASSTSATSTRASGARAASASASASGTSATSASGTTAVVGGSSAAEAGTTGGNCEGVLLQVRDRMLLLAPPSSLLGPSCLILCARGKYATAWLMPMLAPCVLLAPACCL
jgi:hypothetical protein